MNAHTLRSLLLLGLDKRAENGLPTDYRAVENAVRYEEEVRPRGLSLNRTTISQILDGTYKKAPKDGTVRAIGWLADVSDEVAFTAAGHQPQRVPFAMELPRGIDDLTAPERRAALDVLRVLVAQRQEINRHEQSESGNNHDSPAAPGASNEATEDEKTFLFNVFRYDPSDPDVVVQAASLEASSERDARDQVRSGLALAGISLHDNSQGTMVVTHHGLGPLLFEVVRADKPDRDELVFDKLRKLGQEYARELDEKTDPAAGSAGFIAAAADVAEQFRSYMNPANRGADSPNEGQSAPDRFRDFRTRSNAGQVERPDNQAQ